MFQSTTDRFPEHAILKENDRNRWNGHGEHNTTQLQMDEVIQSGTHPSAHSAPSAGIARRTRQEDEFDETDDLEYRQRTERRRTDQ